MFQHLRREICVGGNLNKMDAARFYLRVYGDEGKGQRALI